MQLFFIMITNFVLSLVPSLDIYYSTIQFPRELNVFVPSYIMKKGNNDSTKIEMFEKLNGTNIILGLPPKEQRQLEEYEKFIFKKVDNNLSNEFDKIWGTKSYYKDIEAIESSIQKSLDNYFTFDRILKYVSQDYFIEAKEMIVKFYNFISSIGILSPNVATQLFYAMDEIGPGKEEKDISAVTSSSILGQCISFAKFWASSEDQKLEYDYGFSTTSHFFYYICA